MTKLALSLGYLAHHIRSRSQGQEHLILPTNRPWKRGNSKTRHDGRSLTEAITLPTR